AAEWPAGPLDLGSVTEATRSPPAPRPTQPAPPTAATIRQRLEVPGEIPGSSDPPITVPAPSPDPARKAERDRIFTELYDPRPPLPADPVPIEGPRLDLAQLQGMALADHPALRVAAAAVESARGAAAQAGLPPNPSLGFEADTIGSGGTA